MKFHIHTYRIAEYFRWCKIYRNSLQDCQNKFSRLNFSRSYAWLTTPPFLIALLSTRLSLHLLSLLRQWSEDTMSTKMLLSTRNCHVVENPSIVCTSGSQTRRLCSVVSVAKAADKLRSNALKAILLYGIQNLCCPVGLIFSYNYSVASLRPS